MNINLAAWFDGYHWTFDFEIDPALFEWRYRFFEASNNPFGVA